MVQIKQIHTCSFNKSNIVFIANFPRTEYEMGCQIESGREREREKERKRENYYIPDDYICLCNCPVKNVLCILFPVWSVVCSDSWLCPMSPSTTMQSLHLSTKLVSSPSTSFSSVFLNPVFFLSLFLYRCLSLPLSLPSLSLPLSLSLSLSL